MSPRDPSYRWVVLGVGVVAQGATAAVLQGLPGLAPELRIEYGLGLTGLGVVLGTVTVGLVSTLLLWGAAADRFGERRVMTGGLLAAALWCLLAARATSLGQLLVFLLLAGMSGASVNAASGRAVNSADVAKSTESRRVCEANMEATLRGVVAVGTKRRQSGSICNCRV